MTYKKRAMLNCVAPESLVSVCRPQFTRFTMQELAAVSVCDRGSMFDAIITVNIVNRYSGNKLASLARIHH